MIYAVILCGGAGRRFWPFSRQLEPKQFLRLFGEKSLLQHTVSRIMGVVPVNNIYVVGNKAYFFEIKNELATYGVPEGNILLEPDGKNTAAAIGVAAQIIKTKDNEAILIVLPADHYVKNLIEFRRAIKKSILCAQDDLLATIGISPHKPFTGYGYIKVRGIKSQHKNYFLVERFLEKPSLKEALRYIRSKQFFWNSGIFVWKAAVILEEIKRYLPKLYSVLMQISEPNHIAHHWFKIKPVSIDYGVLEHSRRIGLVPARFQWTDLGSWLALRDVFPKDKNGNVLNKNTVSLGSTGISVFSRSDRLICTIGLKDLIIADTQDALLVCHQDCTEEVKNLVKELKKAKRKEGLIHLTERRPWGSFTVLKSGLGFKIKLIEISPGKRLSLQSHRLRAEHWVVVSGVAKVLRGSETKIVKSNESIYIPQGMRHRLENPSRSAPLKIVEVQTGNYLEEDDIIRFKDDYIRD